MLKRNIAPFIPINTEILFTIALLSMNLSSIVPRTNISIRISTTIAHLKKSLSVVLSVGLLVGSLESYLLLVLSGYTDREHNNLKMKSKLLKVRRVKMSKMILLIKLILVFIWHLQLW